MPTTPESDFSRHPCTRPYINWTTHPYSSMHTYTVLIHAYVYRTYPCIRIPIVTLNKRVENRFQSCQHSRQKRRSQSSDQTDASSNSSSGTQKYVSGPKSSLGSAKWSAFRNDVSESHTNVIAHPSIISFQTDAMDATICRYQFPRREWECRQTKGFCFSGQEWGLSEDDRGKQTYIFRERRREREWERERD